MKKLIRISTMALIAFSLSLSVGACHKDQKKADEPAAGPSTPQMSDQEALPGTWQAGQSTFMLGSDGKYTMQTVRSCGAPPCPTTKQTGTWELRRGKIYLTPAGGEVQVLEYTIGWNPRTLNVTNTRDKQTTTYMYSM
ncbi:MAG: hypothetical protein H6744_09090 [Deltaproteobacteria bacterium]|nr:hypothetical protein [Deltaproteobacteria bacterium]MCB9786835.1 hypothetical protein [Deltaproteobacteria bacterium]